VRRSRSAWFGLRLSGAAPFHQLRSFPSLAAFVSG